jgi:hypothetical protein
MPYSTKRGQFEKARKLGHTPLVESEFVQSQLKKYKTPPPPTDVPPVPSDLLLPLASLPTPLSRPNWLLAFDGSDLEVAVREEYPSTRLGFIQIAGVLVYLDKLLSEAQKRFVDPAAVENASRESLLPLVLSSSNVCRSDATSVRDSWRMDIFDLFKQPVVEGQALLGIYMQLLSLAGRTNESGEVTLPRCSATPDCGRLKIDVPPTGRACPSCGGALFPTDAIRIHEEVLELNANVTALGRLRTLLEHLVMLAYLSYLFERQPHVLGSVAFILDGPLALFGPQAPLKRAILDYLQTVARSLQQKGYRPPLMVGVEKTGQFAEHAAQISKHIPQQVLMRLPDPYIYERILTTRSVGASEFGEDTYYGRKFFYKTATAQMLTITVPCLDPKHLQGVAPDDPSAYATLPTTLALLDTIGTRLYEDALIPVALAHSYAAIPLKIGTQVLTLLGKELLGQHP